MKVTLYANVSERNIPQFPGYTMMFEKAAFCVGHSDGQLRHL
jgi:hypothetical protein